MDVSAVQRHTLLVWWPAAYRLLLGQRAFLDWIYKSIRSRSRRITFSWCIGRLLGRGGTQKGKGEAGAVELSIPRLRGAQVEGSSIHAEIKQPIRSNIWTLIFFFALNCKTLCSRVETLPDSSIQDSKCPSPTIWWSFHRLVTQVRWNGKQTSFCVLRRDQA